MDTKQPGIVQLSTTQMDNMGQVHGGSGAKGAGNAKTLPGIPNIQPAAQTICFCGPLNSEGTGWTYLEFGNEKQGCSHSGPVQLGTASLLQETGSRSTTG